MSMTELDQLKAQLEAHQVALRKAKEALEYVGCHEHDGDSINPCSFCATIDDARTTEIADAMNSAAEDRAAEETGKGKVAYVAACLAAGLKYNWANLTSREQLSWVQFARTGRGL